MNKLALTALLSAMLLQVAGCIITTDDDPVGASFDVAWQLSDGCPTSDAAAEVIAQDRATNERFTDIYNCVDGAGVTALLPLGDYDVWVEITDFNGDTLLAQSNSVSASLNVDGDIVPVSIAAFPGSAGFFGLTWSLVDDSSGAALTCADVFSGGVALTATLANTTDFVDNVWDCEDGQGVTAPIALGTYTVVVSVLDESDLSLGDSVPVDESLTFGNELVDLGNKEFSFQ